MLALLLVTVGVLVQFTISPALVARTGNLEGWGGSNAYFYRHLGSVLVGLAVLVLGFKVHLRWWLHFAHWFLLGALALSALAGLFQTRWLVVGGLSIQPVEMVKLFMILLMAGYIVEAKNHPKDSLWGGLYRNRYSLGLLLLVSVVVGYMQRDLGSLVVIAASAGMMLLVSNLSWKVMTLLASGGLAGLGWLLLSTPYRLTRLLTFLSSDRSGDECLNQGYHICQALIGIGSGGWFGRGWGRSVQVFGYLPEVAHDSIFAIYAEITGFVGTFALVAVMVTLFGIIYRQILRLEDELFLILTGILTWLVVQTAINIGSMLDLLPMKGITLPYISLGGSSLVMVMLATGIMLQISAYSQRGRRGMSARKGLLSQSWIWWAQYSRRRAKKRH